MTNEERVEKFKSSQLVVNCQTKDEAKKFIKWCYENGIVWENGVVGDTKWHDEKTCYRRFPTGSLSFSTMEIYENRDFEIMTYQEFFKEDEMNNLDYILKNIEKKHKEDAICSVLYSFKTGYNCESRMENCQECEFNNTIGVLKYLAEKHDNKIKVTQFEYDLLKSYIENCNASNYNQRLRNYHIVVKMKEKGYFKNLDLDKTVGEIKDLLEVENV